MASYVHDFLLGDVNKTPGLRVPGARIWSHYLFLSNLGWELDLGWGGGGGGGIPVSNPPVWLMN